MVMVGCSAWLMALVFGHAVYFLAFVANHVDWRDRLPHHLPIWLVWSAAGKLALTLIIVAVPPIEQAPAIKTILVIVVLLIMLRLHFRNPPVVGHGQRFYTFAYALIYVVGIMFSLWGLAIWLIGILTDECMSVPIDGQVTMNATNTGGTGTNEGCGEEARRLQIGVLCMVVLSIAGSCRIIAIQAFERGNDLDWHRVASLALSEQDFYKMKASNLGSSDQDGGIAHAKLLVQALAIDGMRTFLLGALNKGSKTGDFSFRSLRSIESKTADADKLQARQELALEILMVVAKVAIGARWIRRHNITGSVVNGLDLCPKTTTKLIATIAKAGGISARQLNEHDTIERLLNRILLPYAETRDLEGGLASSRDKSKRKHSPKPQALGVDTLSDLSEPQARSLASSMFDQKEMFEVSALAHDAISSLLPTSTDNFLMACEVIGAGIYSDPRDTWLLDTAFSEFSIAAGSPGGPGNGGRRSIVADHTLSPVGQNSFRQGSWTLR